MPNRTWTTLIVVAMVGAVALTGCGSANKQAPAAETAAAEATAPQKPKLEVPQSFESEQAKRQFALKAMLDDYYADAEPLLADVVKNTPTDAGAYAYLGTTRYMLKHYDQAIEAWTKAAELDPSRAAEMQNNIGNALRDAKKADEAIAAYQKALALEPTRWSAAVNMADMLKQSNKLDEAIKVLDTAVANNPKEAVLASVADSYKKEATKTN